MISAQRFAFALALIFFAALVGARAQTPSVSTVNVTPDEKKVRIAAVGDVLDMRVVVSDEAGDVVFESGPVTGDKLDWAMTGEGGGRVPPGAYTMTVNYRTSNGKLRRRVEQILVTEEAAGSTEAQASSAPTTAAAASITGEGAANRVAKFTGANTVGNSTITETGGKVGVGVISPAQSLHVFGASSRLRLQSTNGPALTTTEYVTNGRVWQAGAGGSTALNGVANKFFVFDQTANQYRLAVDAAGNVGVGTVTPASKLTVNGGIQILGTGNGIKFADGSIQTKAIAGTINGTGTANRLAKFTGANSFGNSTVTEVSGRVGIGTLSPAVNLQVQGSGVTEAQVRSVNERAALSLNAGLAGGNTVWSLENGVNGVPGLFGIHDRTQNRTRLVINQAGNVGIGTADPLRAIQIGERTDALFTIEPSDGSPNAGYIRFGDNTGWLLRFGRQREFSGGPLNTGTTGTFMTLSDKGGVVISRLTVDFNQPGGVTNVCHTDLFVLANCSSSLRYKTEVQPFVAGLDLVRRLRPISFTWKSGGMHDLGLAAEEVAQVEPLLVTHNEKGEVEGVKYDRLSAVFINAFKEQQQMIEEQARQIERLQAQLDQVKRSIRRKRAAKR
ncbi:MAG TPA: tail fiber domain-containing protein [Pyrinomonadaceae bacterium]|nr:tail fiber domain-containing protein [Pyrinomonadaceae bacterium]